MQLSGLTPGVANHQLQVRQLSVWDEIDKNQDIKVPIFTLEPEKVANWSKMFAGTGTWTSGIVFPFNSKNSEYEDDADDDSTKLTAEQSFHRFRLTASPMARRLAGLVAVAPVVTLPVISLIQQTMLPKSGQIHVAEILLGGLLELKPSIEVQPETNSNEVEYQFIEGVNEIFLNSLSATDKAIVKFNLLKELTQYIIDRIGLSTQTFVGFLRDPRQIGSITQQSNPIALLAVKKLLNLGGKYAQFVDLIYQNYHIIPIMQYKIFYSWQSDLPNSTNRSFIENSLKESVRSIHNDDSIEVELVIDRDTAGIPGSPTIADTIFKKIEDADVFVCDISIINSKDTSSTRKTPNPNVLIELGYAAKVLGWENIIMVTNIAFGILENLPFDLRNRRITTYNSPVESQDRTKERRELKGKLESQLRIIIENLDTKQNTTTQKETLAEQVVLACEKHSPNQESLIQEYMVGLREKLISIDPNTSRPPNIYFDELLVNSIDQTEELILEFAQIAKTIAVHKNTLAAHKLYREFQVILELYKVRPDQTSWRDTDFNFYKFIGHEFFVTFLSFLISENLWQIIADILSTQIYLKNAEYTNEPGLVPFIYASRYPVKTLDDRNRRLGSQRISIHADILYARHSSKEKIKTAIPMQSFMDADYFLLLASLCRSSSLGIWIPWSHVYMNDVPRYLIESSSTKYAEKLLPAIGVKNITEFRECSAAASQQISQIIRSPFPFYTPLSTFDSSTIGSKP